MNSFVLLTFLCTTMAAVNVLGSPNDVDDVIIEGSKAFSLLLPAIALPYAVALIAVLVPLAKAFVLGVMNVFNLPFEALLALYFLLYVAMYTFPQLASLIKVTSVFTARSESARATGEGEMPEFPAGEAVMKWARSFMPASWVAAVMPAAAPAVTTSEATTTDGVTTTAATTEPVVGTTISTTVAQPEFGPFTSETPTAVTSTKSVATTETPSTSSKCASFKVCDSVSRLVKDYPVSMMLMSYLSDYLKGLKYERAVREGMAGLNCTSVYPQCS